MSLVAVYGSLLKDLGNHHVMMGSNGVLVCSATVAGFKMYPIAGRSFPAIVPSTDEDVVTVEVYRVDNMDYLDYLEGYPSHYDRTEVTYLEDDNNTVGTAWIYFQHDTPHDMESISHGNWRKYLDEE